MFQIYNSKQKIFLLFLISFPLFSLYSCRVQYVASYDQVVQNEIIKISSEVDMFYGKLLETPEDQRSYDDFKDDYLKIEVDLRTLLTRNEIRPLNDESIQQTKNALDLWLDDKDQHRTKNTVSDFTLKLHRKQFQRIFVAMAIGESVKEKTD